MVQLTSVPHGQNSDDCVTWVHPGGYVGVGGMLDHRSTPESGKGGDGDAKGMLVHTFTPALRAGGGAALTAQSAVPYRTKMPSCRSVRGAREVGRGRAGS
eukprot:366455-Chlamydomonas_euryale.AAC.10